MAPQRPFSLYSAIWHSGELHFLHRLLFQTSDMVVKESTFWDLGFLPAEPHNVCGTLYTMSRSVLQHIFPMFHSISGSTVLVKNRGFRDSGRGITYCFVLFLLHLTFKVISNFQTRPKTNCKFVRRMATKQRRRSDDELVCMNFSFWRGRIKHSKTSAKK